MRLLNHPGQKTDVGIASPVPSALSKYLYPFGTAEYRSSEFGNCLLQKIKTADFALHFFRLDIREKVTLYPLIEKHTIGLGYVFQGSIAFLLPDYGKKVLREGHCEMFYVSPKQGEVTLEKGIYDVCWLELNPSMIADIASNSGEIQMQFIFCEDENEKCLPGPKVRINVEVKSILREMRTQEQTMKPEKLEVLLYGYIYKLLSLYGSSIETLKYIASFSLPKDEEKLLTIKKYITQNADIHDCSLDDISQQFHIQKDRLKENFKVLFGVPFAQFVHSQCMERAKRLLTNGKSVSKIANELGYSNPNNFSIAFKKYYNCSPLQMRKKMEL